MASADRWNRSARSIAQLVTRHDSLCHDMEAAAIGLVCAARAGVPFVSVKDLANDELPRLTVSGAALVQELTANEMARGAAVVTLEIPSDVASPQMAGRVAGAG